MINKLNHIPPDGRLTSIPKNPRESQRIPPGKWNNSGIKEPWIKADDPVDLPSPATHFLPAMEGETEKEVADFARSKFTHTHTRSDRIGFWILKQRSDTNIS